MLTGLPLRAEPVGRKEQRSGLGRDDFLRAKVRRAPYPHLSMSFPQPRSDGEGVGQGRGILQNELLGFLHRHLGGVKGRNAKSI